MSVSRTGTILKFVLPLVVGVQGVNFIGGIRKKMQGHPSEKHAKCQKEINEMVEQAREERIVKYERALVREENFAELALERHYKDGTIKQFLHPHNPSDVRDIVMAVASDLKDRLYKLRPVAEYSSTSEVKKDCRRLKKEVVDYYALLKMDATDVLFGEFLYVLENRHREALGLQREFTYSLYKEMETFLLRSESSQCERQPLEDIATFPTVDSFLQSKGAQSIAGCFEKEQQRLRNIQAVQALASVGKRDRRLRLPQELLEMVGKSS